MNRKKLMIKKQTLIGDITILALTVMLAVLAMCLSGCGRESERVSHNIAQEADNFNVLRRVVVINTRTDKAEFECIGRIAVDVGSKRLDIIVETDKGKYQKHIVNLTGNNMYIVEDLGGAEVNKYKYEINYLPEMIQPFDIVTKD